MRIKLLALAVLLSCGHAQPPAAAKVQAGSDASPADAGTPKPDPGPEARALSEEAHEVLRSSADLLWKRWTTGDGPLPAGAIAQHPRLSTREAVQAVHDAAEAAQGEERRALSLLEAHLAGLAVARESARESEALGRARAQLAFAAPGDARAEHGEHDLDRLLTEERDAKKRAAIALAEAQAAAPLAALVLARDAADQRALTALGPWDAFVERMHGMPPAALAALAESTLQATEALTAKAVAASATRNLGVTADRLRRPDLPRLVRSPGADAEFVAGSAWTNAKATFEALGLDAPRALRIDAEPSPSKGARPLALLVDPPADVRLSLRPGGGYEEQRATLHEGARALGAAMTTDGRWELAQLGDGAAAEGVAQLFEELCAGPEWLRERTKLRGEPLDEVVHTQATRRLLAARRAAALVLFEVKRREGAPDGAAQAALYRGLLQRATFAVLGDEDGNRWAIEADTWIRTAPLLVGAVLAAQLEEKLGDGWWRKQDNAEALRTVWRGGRSMTGNAAAQAAGLSQALDPQALARVAEKRLAYAAPDQPPPAQKPDYKFMQGDKKKRRRATKNKH